ncbi:MAG: DUF4878 domain-containing protein [Bacteroidia bacterium]|nr:DUF4878 domain-containing protein [Bacteroidia bacterium]
MKYCWHLFLYVILIAVVSCRKDAGPRPVAEQFLKALQQRDYQEAGKYGTRETVKLLLQFEKIEKLNGLSNEGSAPATITIVSEDIKGKTAVVYFREEGLDYEQKLTLQKVEHDGRWEWKVAMKKDELKLLNES